MTPETSPSGYDTFAWFYQKYWGSGPMSFIARALPVLERLVLTRVPQGGRILDLCCGTGQLVGELMRRGYHVTGVDGSEQMLGFARANAPGAEFVHADVRTMTLPSSHDAAVCLFDSLNHLTRPDEVETAFRNVRAAVTSGAPFLCDFNMEPGYQARWRGSFGIAEDDHALINRSAYDAPTKIARSVLTMFRLQQGAWRRADVTLYQRCYAAEEITGALRSAGFGEIVAFDAEHDLGLQGHIGRTFFLARAV